MTAALELTQDQIDFLQKCEEDFKDRFTDNDELFMKVFNATPTPPPIMDPRHSQGQHNRRNNRGAPEHRHGRRDHPYNRYNDGRGQQGDRSERQGDRRGQQGDRRGQQGDRRDDGGGQHRSTGEYQLCDRRY